MDGTFYNDSFPEKHSKDISADLSAVLLPATLAWCGDNADRANAAWPARVLLERFADILRRLADQAEQKRRDEAA